MENYCGSVSSCPYADKIKEYFYCGGLNCAESTMRLLIQELGLDAEPEMIRAMSGFGGGMQRGLTCGAVTAAVAALGIKFGRTEPDMDRKASADAVSSFLSSFETAFGSLACSELINGFESKSDEMYAHCVSYIAAAAKLVLMQLNPDIPENDCNII